ncbi:MAG: ribonuclease R, partial [Desulfobulbaceae bacterium]|nr:ribonuclease R [Desulfobulbaceae bacterium]
MSKKRRKYRFSRHPAEQKTDKRDVAKARNRLENDILACLHMSKRPVAIEKISSFLSGKDKTSDDIHAAANFLLSQKLIRKTGKNQFTLNKTAPLYKGLLELNPKGFGFVTDTVPLLSAVHLSKDPYIAPAMIGSAHHGDMVLIRVNRVRNDGRPESAVITILTHGRDTVAGFFYPESHGGTVYPEDPRFPFSITVKATTPEPHSGDAVIVRLDRDLNSPDKNYGEITELLGNPNNIDVQMRLVIEKFSLPYTFSSTALQEANELPESFIPSADRLDLREIDHITIDGETAKDFDDAICVKKTRNGFQLYVSIADVSYFVQPGSPLDKEAYSRGTSIYFPGRVIPMLPERLSNNLCSLVPDEDRFTVTAILNFDRSGQLLGKKFTRSIIRSHHRFTYTTVSQILIDQNPTIRRLHKPFLTHLKWAHELATALYDRRRKRGSIGFTIPESKITLTDTGEISTIGTIKRNFAHQIIEEFMLAANEAVAEFFSRNHRKGLYRVHEKPDTEKVAEFSAFARTQGLHLVKAEKNPEWFAGIVEQCRGTKTEYIINNLLLRTMKQAHYSPRNVGHFGLASSHYTHFTSPIRRYPDLSVHRELILAITEKTNDQRNKKTDLNLQKKGAFLSARERTGIRAEREMDTRLKVRYMKRHIGENFEAIVSGVNDFAIFIELKDSRISGSISLKDLNDDYYLHDKKRYRLIGEISGKIYQIGDPIQVTLFDVDYSNNRIHFIP